MCLTRSPFLTLLKAFTEYRLLPRHRFPVAIEDCYCTYKWVLKNARSLSVDTQRMMVTGDSAGGNISIAVSMMLMERDHIKPSGALLIYPLTDRRMTTDSMRRYTDTPVWNSRVNHMFWRNYLTDFDPSLLKLASPIEAESLSDFPETYLEVAEYDCLHDEGIAFAKRLQEEGVPTEYHEVRNTCHGFEDALESTIVRDCVDRRLAWIKRVLA